MAKGLWCVMSVCIAGAIGGCHWTAPLRDTPRTEMPSDFSLQLIVEGDLEARDTTERSAVFVLEADRRLRVGVGPVNPSGLFPRVVRRLSHQQFIRIITLVNDRGLLAEPSSPTGELALRGRINPRVVYHVDLTLNGRINRYVTTPEESPPTVRLLKLLLEIR